MTATIGDAVLWRGIRVNAESQILQQRIAVWFTTRDAQGHTTHVADVELVMRPVNLDQYDAHRAPLFLPRSVAQELLDELWRLGLRPMDGAGALAHVESLQAHIGDLRAIAFKTLEVKAP